jgi:trehalose 6-phosphate synthase
VRLSLRFVLPLLIALSLFAWAAVPLTDALMTRWFVRDLEIRSDLIQSTVQESLDELMQTGSDARVVAFFNKLTRDERLYAVGLCWPPWNSAPVASSNYPQSILRCSSIAGIVGERSRLLSTANGMLHVSVRPIGESASNGPRLVLVHDMSFVDRRTEETH